jgi:hypothetical protein
MARGRKRNGARKATNGTPRGRVLRPTQLRLTKYLRSPAARLPELDGRSTWVRRWKSQIERHVTMLGGQEIVSESEMILCMRAATLICELERREVGFAQTGEISDDAIEVYQRVVNTLRRVLESLGLQRRAREVGTLGSIINSQRRQLEQRGVIEAEVEPP